MSTIRFTLRKMGSAFGRPLEVEIVASTNMTVVYLKIDLERLGFCPSGFYEDIILINFSTNNELNDGPVGGQVADGEDVILFIRGEQDVTGPPAPPPPVLMQMNAYADPIHALSQEQRSNGQRRAMLNYFNTGQTSLVSNETYVDAFDQPNNVQVTHFPILHNDICKLSFWYVSEPESKESGLLRIREAVDENYSPYVLDRINKLIGKAERIATLVNTPGLCFVHNVVSNSIPLGDEQIRMMFNLIRERPQATIEEIIQVMRVRTNANETARRSMAKHQQRDPSWSGRKRRSNRRSNRRSCRCYRK